MSSNIVFALQVLDSLKNASNSAAARQLKEGKHNSQK